MFYLPFLGVRIPNKLFQPFSVFLGEIKVYRDHCYCSPSFVLVWYDLKWLDQGQQFSVYPVILGVEDYGFVVSEVP